MAAAALASIIPSVAAALATARTLLQRYKPATAAAKLLEAFPQIQDRFGQTNALRVAKWLIALGQRRGYGVRGRGMDEQIEVSAVEILSADRARNARGSGVRKRGRRSVAPGQVIRLG